jgi:hypothetical protein
MTDEMMSLRARGEDPDGDVLREMIGFAAERLMALKVGALAGAPYRPTLASAAQPEPAPSGRPLSSAPVTWGSLFGENPGSRMSAR